MKNKKLDIKKLKEYRIEFYIGVIFIDLFVVLFTYFLMPIVQNFPPLGENFGFQKLVQPITHIGQYTIIFVIGIFVHFISFKFLFRYIDRYLKKYNNKDTFAEDKIVKVRQECQNVPYKILLIQLFIFISLGLIFNLIMLVQPVAIIKFTLMVIAIASMVSVLTFILAQKYLTNVLLSTYSVTQFYTNNIGYRINNTKSLMLQTIPFIAVVLIILSLIGYSKAVEQKGIASANYYKAHFYNLEIENKKINKDYLVDLLEKIPLNHNSDTYFILDYNNEIVYISNSKVNISKFPFIYRDYFFEEFNEGMLYEAFGVDEQIYCIKIIDNENRDWYIGYKFRITDETLLIYYSTIFLVLIFFYAIILYIWAKNHTINLSRVSNKLKEILESEHIDKETIVPIVSNDEIGDLTFYYNKIQKKLIEQQDVIKQQGQLASLGQMMGGIAHNLKTPILSIAGAAEGIKDLAEEMEESLTTPTVTLEDKKEILKEQEEWVEKIKVHLEYMNDIITAVKGQATTFTTDREEVFTVQDLFKNVKILTAHEFKNSLTEIEIINHIEDNFIVKGDFNSLLQIINNIIVNAIQSYEGKPNNKVRLIANLAKESDDLVISVQDYGKGIPKAVQEKLFKQMVTTKGKYGTGLGLYMSYSTIKGKFGGDIRFESEEGKGTTFHILIPIHKKGTNTSKKAVKVISEYILIDGTKNIIKEDKKKTKNNKK